MNPDPLPQVVIRLCLYWGFGVSRQSVCDPSVGVNNSRIRKIYKSLLNVTKNPFIHWVIDRFGQLYWLEDGDGVNTGSD